MIPLLVHVIIVLVIFAVVFWIISIVPIPHPFGRIAQVVVGVILLIYLLQMLLPYAGGGGPVLR